MQLCTRKNTEYKAEIPGAGVEAQGVQRGTELQVAISLSMALRMLQEVMMFVPEERAYTPEMGRKLGEYRRRVAAELRVSPYVLKVKGIEEVRREAKAKAEAESAGGQNLV